jgi:hypothetical protein
MVISPDLHDIKMLSKWAAGWQFFHSCLDPHSPHVKDAPNPAGSARNTVDSHHQQSEQLSYFAESEESIGNFFFFTDWLGHRLNFSLAQDPASSNDVDQTEKQQPLP